MAGRRVLRRVLAGGAALAAAGWVLRDVPAELGVRPLAAGGERADRMRGSARFSDGVFVNPMAGTTLLPGRPPPRFLRELVTGRDTRRPAGAVPLRTPSFVTSGVSGSSGVPGPSGMPDPSRVPGSAGVSGSSGPSGDGGERDGDGLRVVWFGHASTLVEIEGRNVLFDPVWSRRVSPTRLVGPKRLHPAPVGIEDLPEIDAIVISHDHYDHLDLATVRALTRVSAAPFLVPLGIGAHLDRWGVPPERVVELDWEEEALVAGLRFTATAARHFSGRAFTRNDTLWGSWSVAGARRRVFYAGDSGYFDGYARIGADHGPFDLTLMPIGAYSPAWPDIHMDPEEAVNAHLDLGGHVMLPVHWATFTLALHSWSEPPDRLWREAKTRDVRIVVPRPGETVDLDDPSPVDGWWQTLGV